MANLTMVEHGQGEHVQPVLGLLGLIFILVFFFFDGIGLLGLIL